MHFRRRGTRAVRRSGFTLAELLMAILASSILAILVGSMLVFGYRSWMDNWDAVNAQQDASLAMDAVGRLIRETRAADISIGPNEDQISFKLPDGSVNTISPASNGRLVLGNGFPLVRHGLQDFEVRYDSPGLPSSIYVKVQTHNTNSGTSIVFEGNYIPRNVF